MNDTPAPTALTHLGRRALITGGTSGTGLATAHRLVARGAEVVINGRDRERGEAALAELRAAGGTAHLALGECADPAQAASVVRDAVEALGGLDIVVSAGARGSGDPKRFREMTPEEIRDTLNSRFLARVLPVHAALDHLERGESPSVVLLTTDAGRHATAGESVIGAYAASVIAFTKTLARETGRAGLRVNAVSMTLTSGTRSFDDIFGEDSYQKDLFSKALDRFPAGRAPSAGEVADVVVFLTSPEAGQVTGQTISVNGGLSFGGW